MSSPPPISPPLRPPGWAMTLAARSHAEISGFSAAFAAGASLAMLDTLVRRDAPFAGAWRGRLALAAAAASLEGRAGDEASLRDTFALTRPGADPGPMGRVYVAWRTLASHGARRLPEIAAGLGASATQIADLSTVLEIHARSAAPAPLAAAAAVVAAMAVGAPRAAALAVADIVLAARLGWPTPLPLLALEAHRACPGDAAGPALCGAAYARAAARACDLHADLANAAARLEAVAPKLRAKGAAAALAALLDNDAVSGATEIPGLSERGLRRLFDRLIDLGAVRELTGRPTFRLYGL